MKSNQKNSIAFRLSLLVLVFSLGLAAALTAFRTYSDYRAIAASTEEKLEEIHKSNSMSIAESLWVMDQHDIRLQLEGLLNHPNLEAVKIFKEARLLASAGALRSRRVIQKEYPLYHAYNGKQVNLGTLSITAGLDAAHRNLFRNILRRLFSEMVLILLISVFILFIVHVIVTRRLSTIAKYVTKLNPREKREPLNIHKLLINGTQNELDQVVTAINAMEEGLRNSYYKLNEEIKERKQAEEKQQQTAARILRQREVLSRITISRWMNEGHVVKAAGEMTEAVATAFGIERVGVWLFNEDKTELVCVDLYEATPKKHTVGAVLYERQSGDQLQAFKSPGYVAADEPLTDPRTAGYVETYLKPLGITSMLDGAIITGGRHLGVLCFEHVNQPHHWEQDEISFNQQLADQIGMAVLNRERRKAEDALLESEARYRGLFEAESDAIVLVDNETGRILEANNAASVLYGYGRDELLAGNNVELSAEPEETLRITRETAVNSEQLVIIPLRFHRKKDGTVFPVEITGRFFEQNGRSVHIAAIRDITGRKRAEEQVLRSLKEKEVMLKEIHHRVKNNMQVIYSLLNLQAKGIADTAVRAMFEDARNRVNSMALIHEKLYQSKDLAHINFNEYLRSLVAGIADTYKRRDVVFSVDSEPVALDVNVGIPCGLIVNELVSNCLKYAFPEGEKGTVRVGIRSTGEGGYVLTVADNGAGFPETVDFRNTSSLGLQLVNVLVGQIQGTIELSKVEGTKFSIMFPGSNC